jgi:hypothetical protein
VNGSHPVSTVIPGGDMMIETAVLRQGLIGHQHGGTPGQVTPQ